jgi:hypothetical protein
MHYPIFACLLLARGLAELGEQLRSRLSTPFVHAPGICVPN